MNRSNDDEGKKEGRKKEEKLLEVIETLQAFRQDKFQLGRVSLRLKFKAHPSLSRNGYATYSVMISLHLPGA
ncbi:hypothetical protein RUM44_000103 [Polyplax serrata]|uniref:Uncharacterized protein n=1 Tax=Polyplax serrata TaxID=468196 RepID=A0ABR1B659_POLSC